MALKPADAHFATSVVVCPQPFGDDLLHLLATAFSTNAVLLGQRAPNLGADETAFHLGGRWRGKANWWYEVPLVS